MPVIKIKDKNCSDKDKERRPVDIDDAMQSVQIPQSINAPHHPLYWDPPLHCSALPYSSLKIVNTNILQSTAAHSICFIVVIRIKEKRNFGKKQ